MYSESKKRVFWIMGRGVSIDCGLRWDGSHILGDVTLDRETKIEKICSELSEKQILLGKEGLKPYQKLLQFCEKETSLNFRHTFSTLNWDTLFERAVNERGWKMHPQWIDYSQLLHWNGSIESGCLGRKKSHLPQNASFILPSDPPSTRTKSIEGNTAFNKIAWTQILVICGVSFQHVCDDIFPAIINYTKDETPLGECQCIIVNPHKKNLKTAQEKLQGCLQKNRIKKVPKKFSQWVETGCPELKEFGI